MVPAAWLENPERLAAVLGHLFWILVPDELGSAPSGTAPRSPRASTGSNIRTHGDRSHPRGWKRWSPMECNERHLNLLIREQRLL
jgi:hypothetical protein